MRISDWSSDVCSSDLRLSEPERKAVRSALGRIVAAAVLIWVLGFALWVVLLPERGDDGIRTDGIVVMTGGPGRVDRGVDLLRAGRAKRLLVSGVARTVRPHELALTVDAPPSLFQCCVDLGREAVDTQIGQAQH